MSEPTEVIVALVGEPSGTAGYDLLPEAFWKVPYEDRPKVSVQASLEETLGNVLDTAAAEFGVSTGAFVAFYRPEDDSAGLTSSPVVPLVNDEELVTWGHRFGDVRYRDLLRAGDAGVLNGDPRRPYLILQPGIGNGVLPDWHTIQVVWETVSYVLASIAAAGGAAATLSAAKRRVIDRLQGRAQAATAVIEQRGDEWVSRNGEPYDVDEWLDNRPWLPADLAPMLGCTEDQAEAILWAFGFAPASSGLWRRSATEEASLFAQTARLAVRGYTHEASEEELRTVVREEIEFFLDKEEARPFNWERLPWFQKPSETRDKAAQTFSPLYHARAWLKKVR